MKASELRIGNYVSLHGVLVEMTASDFNFDESYFKPIPLTEEWLLKFGFVRRGITSNLGKLTLHHKEAMYPNGRVYFNSWAILEKIPDYVHQLQNLYFALTNEELTYEQQKNLDNRNFVYALLSGLRLSVLALILGGILFVQCEKPKENLRVPYNPLVNK